MPPLTSQVLRSAAKTFKRRIGLGCDSVHPRAFAWLSDAALQGIADLLTAIEELGFWPGTIGHILIALIPKAGGGKRPIGLLSGLVRLWERARRLIVQSWRTKVF